MRTGDAWFSASLTKSSVHALCVCVWAPGNAGGSAPLFVWELALSRQNEGESKPGSGFRSLPSIQTWDQCVCVVALPTSVCFVFI